MKIHVRRRHIVAGQRKHPYSCPLALAIKDVVGGAVVATYACFRFGRKYHRATSSAQKFMRDFDAGKPVKPFAFVLK